MEALLSLAFDNIASKNTQKIRKGLRQIEGLLAQICLSSGKSKPSTPSHRRNASAINIGEQQAQTPKKLGQLSEDLAFREFFRLQEGFEWNGEFVLIAALGCQLIRLQSVCESQTALRGFLECRPVSTGLVQFNVNGC